MTGKSDRHTHESKFLWRRQSDDEREADELGMGGWRELRSEADNGDWTSRRSWWWWRWWCSL